VRRGASMLGRMLGLRDDCLLRLGGRRIRIADRFILEAQIERFAPGFRDLVLAKSVRTAADMERYNPNYVGGDIGVGLQTIRQTILRPVARWNPYRTPIRGLYLCSSATPPIPGVHGRCGELAALTALRDVFGIRDTPDISPARLRPASTRVPRGETRLSPS